MVFHPILFSPLLLRTSPSICVPAANISEIQLKRNEPQQHVSFSGAYSSSASATPIVIDSGATFSTTPFEADISPGTLERIKGSVKNLSGDSAITARGFSC